MAAAGQVWILVSVEDEHEMRAVNTTHIIHVKEGDPTRAGERRTVLRMVDETSLTIRDTFDVVMARIMCEDIAGSFVAGAEAMRELSEASISPFDTTKLQQLIEERDKGNVTAAARRIGIAQATLLSILIGTNPPRDQTRDLIARAYGVTVDYFR